MATRKELIEGVGQRYRTSSGEDKPKILGEFVRLTGYHRKHAIRVLNCSAAKPAERRPRERVYDEAVRQALIIYGILRTGSAANDSRRRSRC